MKKGSLTISCAMMALSPVAVVSANEQIDALAKQLAEQKALNASLKAELQQQQQLMQQVIQAVNNHQQVLINHQDNIDTLVEKNQRVSAEMQSQLPEPQQPVAQTSKVAVSADSPAIQPRPETKVAAANEPAPTATNPPAQESAPKSRSAEDVYQEAGNVFTRKFTLETAFRYSYFDRKDLSLSGFLALDSIFLGDINLDRVRSNTFNVDFTGRYTINDRWQAELSIPTVYRWSDYQTVGQNNSSDGLESGKVDSSGIGDISAGIYYRLLKETEDMPDLVWNLRLTAPTGKDPYGIATTSSDSGNLTIPNELPTGNGVWGLGTGISLVKTYDPAIVFLNLNYNHQFEESFSDISSAQGNQAGKVKLGDSWDYGLGVAFAISERMSLAINFSQSMSRTSKQRLDGGDWLEVIGSDSNSATLGIGSTMALTQNLSMVTQVSSGLSDDAADYAISVRFPYRF
ncbi:autotransporter outer membrane beta-barrel domain-containing protein [Vibrio sinaloensis]|uniref:autotransporter outer membrane beta-barrel domain-containing protein n=1 Tax=Photobacterium sp. (strain ATCC 43367) TaxID=379097 RepID=UPI0020712178|nr:autotransporter outer membrane beta-barrel domain-containing protein [Vibrio sinaloensis]UPQ90188.1 autotransporter outer membrane beta-barrel domain-containing protein [Vibrio sinaloensis]